MPTLVLHATGDRVAPIEEGRHIARTMANASFVELPGANHLLLEGTPAFERFFEGVDGFLDRHAH